MPQAHIARPRVEPGPAQAAAPRSVSRSGAAHTPTSATKAAQRASLPPSRVDASDRRCSQNTHTPLPLQAKLAIGRTDDPLEREADLVAAHVMRVPDRALPIGLARPQISRKCAACNEEDDRAETLLTKRVASQPESSEAPAIVHDVIRSHGQPLDAAARGYFEPRFGQDFSGVRVHTDDRSAESAVSIGASAYTAGSNIVFAAGRYDPASASGRRLLAHELTHVVQQRALDPRGALPTDARIQREDEAIPAEDPPPTPAPSPSLAPTAKPPAAFQDNFNPIDNPVNVPVRMNALDFLGNLRARLGDDGGRTETTLVGGATPTLDAKGKISGLVMNWNIKRSVPVPDYSNSQVAAAEKAAINALVSRIGQHEDGHVSISKTGRTGFALSMKGKPESDLDNALEAQRCNVAWVDRDFDNKEGDIGLASDNTVTVKGKDHPEYTAGCPPRKR
jgi:Domain of unknown function (DUF4157)